MTGTRCYLRPGTWTRLPDSDWEVFLAGKMRSQHKGVEVLRTGTEDRFDGWDLRPILGRAFTRRVTR